MSSERIARWGVVLLAACAGGFVGTVIQASGQWIGSTFPGFLLLENGVVASIALDNWGDQSDLFQTRAVVMQEAPINRSAEVYARVRARPPGTNFEYRFRRPDGTVLSRGVVSRIFGYRDYFLVFGSMLMSGSGFLLAGLAAFGLKPRLAASRGFASAGLWAGLVALTSVDLYGPYYWLQLHAFAECLLPASLLHFALVFPTDRISSPRLHTFTIVYLPFLVLAVAGQLLLFDPVGYPVVHGIAIAAGGLGSVLVVVTIFHGLLTNSSVLVRRRLGVVTLGALAGFVLPTFLWVASRLTGGSIPVTAVGLSAFLFPLSLAYGIVKQDLFEIDLTLHRAMLYGSLVLAIAIVYFGVLIGPGLLVPGAGASTWSPATLAVVNFGLLFVLAPLREGLERAIGRIFFRNSYEIQTSLSQLSSALSHPHVIEEVLAAFETACDNTVCPEHVTVHLQRNSQSLLPSRIESEELQEIELPPGLAARLESGRVISRYEVEAGDDVALAHWRALSAEVIIPLHGRERLLGVAVFGPRRSGHPYGARDLSFLQAALNQVALALATADAFEQLDASKRKLERLNEGLEEQVRARTAELNTSNRELNASVTRLQAAYAQLEQSQDSLLRADRLATLGQLTAGIAHEMNTPLSAVLNALRVLGELGCEYRDSINDPDVLPDDHRAIADEVISNAEAAERWAAKAAGYIRSVKARGREYQPGNCTRFPVKAVVDETHALLAHRMRVSACSFDTDPSTERIIVEGDPAILSQIILNLVTNAIDAYEDADKRSGRIAIKAVQDEGGICIEVRDWAGGIPADVLPHIFDELYTTKGPGRGTGLGLWITCNLVEQRFGGTLEVETETGVGSLFTLRLPQRASDSQPPADEKAVARAA